LAFGMLVVTVYSSTLLDDMDVIEACLRAIEELRSVYGVTVLLEVIDVSLLGIHALEEPVVAVGDIVIRAGSCDPGEVKERVVDAVLRSIALRVRHVGEALELSASPQAPGEFAEVA
jgi:hypothetical protein